MSLQILLLLPCLLLVSSSYCSDIIVNYENFNDFFNLDEYIAKLRKSLVNRVDDAISSDVVLKMVDASSKIPSGIFYGNLYDLGDFDECYNIHEGSVYGKYCLGQLTLPGSQNQTSLKLFNQNFTEQRPIFQIHPEPRAADGGGSLGVYLAACVPSFMDPKDIPLPYLRFTEDGCYSKDTEPELSGGAIAVIVVLAVFLTIMVASTVFDIYLYYTNKESPHELLISFSVLTNGRKIFTSTSNPEQLLCLNGIKAISMMWVILGHEYSNALNTPISNFNGIMDFVTDPANMFIRGGTVSVDTFFLVGGLVTVYTFLKSMDKGVKFNIILFYIHRYLRLTPALLIMMLIHLFLVNYMGNGPIWKVVDITLVDTCETSWWSTLLYITNYVRKGVCVPQAWYLTVDMQLYVLSPLVLIPLSKFPKIGLISLGFLIVAGILIPFGVGYGLNLGNMMMDEKFSTEYYGQTYTRFGPYVIGMLLGYIIYKMKKTGWKLNVDPVPKTLIICVSWLICLTGLIACVYAGNDITKISFTNLVEPDRWGNSLYLAFNRNAWAVAVSIAIFLCVAGYGGPINSFLSLPIFQILTKLSYSMYLVHFLIITLRYSMMKTLFRFSHLSIMHAFWGDFMFTLFFSLILCLSFESPIIIIEKYVFGRGAPPKRRVVDDKKPEP